MLNKTALKNGSKFKMIFFPKNQPLKKSLPTFTSPFSLERSVSKLQPYFKEFNIYTYISFTQNASSKNKYHCLTKSLPPAAAHSSRPNREHGPPAGQYQRMFHIHVDSNFPQTLIELNGGANVTFPSGAHVATKFNDKSSFHVSAALMRNRIN